MTELGYTIFQIITVMFLLYVVISSTLRAINKKGAWHDVTLVCGAILSLLWVINI